MSSDEMLAHLSPSARLVYLALEDADRPLTKQEIADRTYSKTRSVTKGISDLRDVDLIDSQLDLEDNRYRRYSLEKL
ncbi:ArsR family transcriptional regulator [Haloterrigena salifodinae]|uniref:ArsR family transcriptional regulator n=1 Tax=Haloterrigena salifodinae TaxID=2675099 RepID=A0A8T8DXE0_9EURY|nr:ArsR family transcriptional regulator [Haloterrigena salifodinae]QRV14199.1 ArsR family transcriptional regulator [Haloterrigena salifodinae]